MDGRIDISIPSVGVSEWIAMRGPLDSGWLTQGTEVQSFESEFALRHQVDFAVATTSCTTALHLMMVSAGIGKGDEVIIPSFTWVATANAVVQTGATPILVDVDPVSYNIDARDVVRKVTERTRAVIAVHLFGLCCDVLTLRSDLPAHVVVLEDAACAAGASFGSAPAGSLGQAAAFSFHPRKTITTGEGGMLVTNIDELASKARVLRSHGVTVSDVERHRSARPFDLPGVDSAGFNYRMTDIQAAMGRVQLGKLDQFIDERERLASLYDDALRDLDVIQRPQRPPEGQHSWQAYVVRVLGPQAHNKRDRMMEYLDGIGVSTRPGTQAVHSLDYYASTLRVSDQDLPGAAICRDTTIAIPMHNRLTEQDLERVVSGIRGAVRACRA